MIKINLLPYRAQRKKQIIQEQLIIGIIPVVLTLLVISLFWWSIKSDIAKADQDIVATKKEIEKQKVTMKEIENYKKKKIKIKKKMDIINSLQKGKSGPVHILDELASNLPGRLWLVDIEQKGMSLNIKGKSLDNISISNYMINLEKSPYFKGIDLKEIKTEKKRGPKGVQLKNFIITCNIIYKLPKKTKL